MGFGKKHKKYKKIRYKKDVDATSSPADSNEIKGNTQNDAADERFQKKIVIDIKKETYTSNTIEPIIIIKPNRPDSIKPSEPIDAADDIEAVNENDAISEKAVSDEVIDTRDVNDDEDNSEADGDESCNCDENNNNEDNLCSCDCQSDKTNDALSEKLAEYERIIEKLTAEKQTLETEKSELSADNELLIAENAILKGDKEQLNDDIERLTETNKELTEKNKRLFDANQWLAMENEGLKTENEDCINTYKMKEEQCKAQYESHIRQLETAIKLQSDRVEPLLDNRKMREQIIADVNTLNEQFGEAAMILRKIMDTATYGNRGLKQLCGLWKTIAPLDDQNVKVITTYLERILTDCFDAEKIEPSYGEPVDLRYHEPKLYGHASGTVTSCVMPGWKYNDEVIIKAVVEI